MRMKKREMKEGTKNKETKQEETTIATSGKMVQYIIYTFVSL